MARHMVAIIGNDPLPEEVHANFRTADVLAASEAYLFKKFICLDLVFKLDGIIDMPTTTLIDEITVFLKG